MRVISGCYKRRLLTTLFGNNITRPTSDRVKENIFNIISNEISDAIVFDLFAGSGAIGIEALSRGAKAVVFVESNKEAIEIIKKNLSNLNISENNYIIINKDVTNFLNSNTSSFKADIVIADPPYSSEWYETAISEIENSNICNSNCTVIFEMPSNGKIRLKSHLNNWNMDDERKYGKTKLEIWRKRI